MPVQDCEGVGPCFIVNDDADDSIVGLEKVYVGDRHGGRVAKRRNAILRRSAVMDLLTGNKQVVEIESPADGRPRRHRPGRAKAPVKRRGHSTVAER